MRLRGSAIATFAVLLAVGSLAAVTAEHVDGNVEENSFRFFPVIDDETLWEIDFHPDGDVAYLVGGSFEDPRFPGTANQYMISYDGLTWDIVYKNSGTDKGPLMDVAWRPQGDYALVPAAGDRQRGSILKCNDPCESARNDTEELWRPNVTALANGGFTARQVAWHPSGDHALVTGGGLIRWNGTTFTMVHPGEKTFFNAAEWHPDGGFALVQRDLNRVRICWAPCENVGHLEPVGINFTESGKGTPSIEKIYFHPDGDRAYVLGLDNQRGKLLEIVLNNQTERGECCDGWETTYYTPQTTYDNGQTEDKFGELTGMSWYPDGNTSLVTSSLSQQVTEFDKHPDGPHDFHKLMDRKGPKLYDVALRPDGKYALFGGQHGFYRYDPDGVPVTRIEEPALGGDHEFTYEFEVHGTAQEKRDGEDIQRFEWVLTQRPELFGTMERSEWTNLSRDNWTRQDDGNVTWEMTLDASVMEPGDYVLGVRADDGEVVGPPGVTTFHVPGPEVTIEAPANHTRAEGTVEVTGSAEARVPEDEITAVEWRVTATKSNLDARYGSWHEANITSTSGPNAEWSFEWNTTHHTPCHKTVEVRARQTGDFAGFPSYIVQFVPDCLNEPPELSVDEIDHGNDTVVLNWTKVRAATSYAVEMSEDPRFFEEDTTEVFGGDRTHFAHEVGENGEYYYRVMASNDEYNESTVWSDYVVVEVEDPPPPGEDGDGTGSGDGTGDGDSNVIRGPDEEGDPLDPGSDDGSDDGSDGGDFGSNLVGDGEQGVPGPGVAAAAAALAAAAAARRRRP